MFYYKWIKIIYCKGGGGGGATQAARVASAPNKEPNSYIKSGAAKITFVLYVTKLSSLQKMDQYTESEYCRYEI